MENSVSVSNAPNGVFVVDKDGHATEKMDGDTIPMEHTTGEMDGEVLSTSESSQHLKGFKLFVTLLGLCFAVFCVALDNTIIAIKNLHDFGWYGIFTSHNFYQNLVSALFLSPTGATKLFDAAADGYCRGEGVGFVHVKKFSGAIADGDHVLGVIAGSAVNQSQNCTAITVPHHGSQSHSLKHMALAHPLEIPLNLKAFVKSSGVVIARSRSMSLLIPLQAHFSTLNPKIPALEPDKMVTPRNTADWTAQFNVACINNYGAAGSNATMIVTQAPSRRLESLNVALPKRHQRKFPVHISANTKGALNATCRALSKPKPIVLVFGGQSTNRAGLNRGIFDVSILLQRYLDDCDHTLRSLNLTTLYPGIFTLEPIHDVVKLHSFLFSLQYATAMAWIECGVKPAVLGPERRAMVTIDADIQAVMEIIADMKSAGHNMEIACFNGPTSHVRVGRQASTEHLETLFAARKAVKSPVKYKVLKVTHGYHSVFTEPLISHLNKLAGNVSYGEPIYEVETYSDRHSWAQIEPHLVAEHTRVPVYFGQAINRIQCLLGPCPWLETGSGSPAIAIVRRALAPESVSSHTLQPMQLGNDRPTALLADAIWIDHAALPSDAPPSKVDSGRDPDLLTFVRFLDPLKRQEELLVDTRSTEWKLYVQGPAFLAESFCPAPLYVELVAPAIKTLAPELSFGASLRIDNLDIMSPLGVATDRVVLPNMQRTDGSSGIWGFAVTSHRRGSPKLNKEVTHALGKVSISNSSSSLNDFERYERLVGLDRAENLVAETAADAMQGSMIYKVFSKVVTYADFYKGVRSVYAKGCDVTAISTLPELTQPILGQSTAEPLAMEDFIHVVSLQLNFAML
ncbi:hypothetical protein MMC22_000530 [Lobaria immixta]|nr:hypothetical protein [Lobaria immixta]